MTTIADVRQQMATIAKTNVTGLRGGFPYQADALKNLPSAYIARPAYDPRLVLSLAKQQYQFEFIIYAPRTLDQQTQKLLDTFAEPSGASSVVAALQTSANWGSVDVDYASVTNVGAVQEAEVAGIAYFVIVFDVEVVW